MPHSVRLHPESPFSPRSACHLRVVSEEPETDDPTSAPSGPDHTGSAEEDAEPIANIMPANAAVAAPAGGVLPAPVRWVAKAFAVICWIPIILRMFVSIPSQTRRAWRKAFGPKEE